MQKIPFKQKLIHVTFLLQTLMASYLIHRNTQNHYNNSQGTTWSVPSSLQALSPTTLHHSHLLQLPWSPAVPKMSPPCPPPHSHLRTFALMLPLNVACSLIPLRHFSSLEKPSLSTLCNKPHPNCHSVFSLSHFIFLHTGTYCHLAYYLFLLVYYFFPPLECKLHEDRDCFVYCHARYSSWP